MPLLGQASGGWTESSSALRLLYVGQRNSIGLLADDAFTQTNPPSVTTASTVSAQVDRTAIGVLSGSVAFTRPDQGENYVGGPGSLTTLQGALNVGIRSTPAWAIGFKAVGCFINSANGNAFENTPGTASGVGPYVSGQGTFGNSLFETQFLAAVGQAEQGDALTYSCGLGLIGSLNGYLMPQRCLDESGGVVSLDTAAFAAETTVDTSGAGANNATGQATLIGVLKMAPDATQNELVFDQRI